MSEWNEERVAQLRKLYADGLSANRIAAILGGVSRNAVIGKCLRLGFEPRHGPRAEHTPERKAPNRDWAKVARELKEKPQPVFGGIPLLELTSRSCRFRHGGLFCGHDSPVGSSWCEYHRGVVFQPPRIKR